MAKKLINNSLGIICLGDKNLIPGGDPVEVTDEELGHPFIAAKIKARELTVEEGEKALEDMSATELKAYAAGKEIDLGAAKSKQDIIAVIKAAEEKKAEAGE